MNEEQVRQLVQLLVQSGAAQDENQAMQIIQMASQGDQQAQQIVQEVVNQAQQQAQSPVSAKLGAKLEYMSRLKNICPEGQELKYYKIGGKVCKVCGGKKMATGGVTLKKKKNDKLNVGNFKCGGKKHKKGGILVNKGTAFGDGTKGANPRNTDHGGHKSHGNTKAASYMKKTNVPNKFTAFGDTGKAKPTNVGAVGHRATGQVSRMQSKYTTSDTVNKHTAFGGHINRSHRKQAACPSTKGWKKIKGMPKGHGGTSGWQRIHQNGGSLNGIPFYQEGKPLVQFRAFEKPISKSSPSGITYRRNTFNSPGGETIIYTSNPDKFGRSASVERLVVPRYDGTFNNDTLYQAYTWNNNADNDKIMGSAYEHRNNGKTIKEGNYSITPGSIGKSNFKTWRDYFEYLNKLPRTVTPRK